MTAPAAYAWGGGALTPLPRFAGQCERQFAHGQTYCLAEVQGHSPAASRWYLAAVRETWARLPENLADRFPSPEHLRTQALIQAGYYNEQTVDAGTNTTAQRVAAALRSREPFSAVSVHGPYVVIRDPKRQSYPAMPKDALERSIDAVLDITMGLSGPPLDALGAAARRAP